MSYTSYCERLKQSDYISGLAFEFRVYACSEERRKRLWMRFAMEMDAMNLDLADEVEEAVDLLKDHTM